MSHSQRPPRFPTPPQQRASSLNLELHLGQPEASSSRAPPPYFDTVLRLGVTPQTEDAPPLAYAAADEEILEVTTKSGKLKALLDSYITHAKTMEERVMTLTETNTALNAALDEATHPTGGGGLEEAQSSSLDPDQSMVFSICCKRCRRKPATMMAWPCNHLCLCQDCVAGTDRCASCKAKFSQPCTQVKFD